MRIPTTLIGTSLIAAALAPVGVFAQQPVKVGFVMFLSGPAASPFGVPAKNAADFVVEELNAGRGPAPYNKPGFGGSKIEMVQIDEAGPATSVVTEYRNLVQRSNVDLVIGYISSGNCLAIAPGVETKTSQMPKLFAGQYNAEISALLGSGAEVIHSSFWDGDLEALILQASPRGLMDKSVTVLTTGETAMHKLAAQIPDGTVLGARGPFGPYAPDNAYNRWFSKGFEARFQAPPNYASYQMAQAILGVKAAWEKATAANGGKRPTDEQLCAALEHLSFEGPGGQVRMAIGKGHQAIMETAYGMTKRVGGKLTMVNVKRYPAETVNPPEGVKSADWISGGFKKETAGIESGCPRASS